MLTLMKQTILGSKPSDYREGSTPLTSILNSLFKIWTVSIGACGIGGFTVEGRMSGETTTLDFQILYCGAKF